MAFLCARVLYKVMPIWVLQDKGKSELKLYLDPAIGPDRLPRHWPHVVSWCLAAFSSAGGKSYGVTRVTLLWGHAGGNERGHVDLKAKKEVVEATENGRDAPTNGNANEENGEQKADNEVDEEEEGGEFKEEEEEGDGEEEDGDEDEEAEAATGKRAAEDDDDEDVDAKKQKTAGDDEAAKKEGLNLKRPP
ncbi:PREDICTED: prothymosin alpha-like [Chrysochloris asiatica]|uniref:Prothymosin alpha n=1 Tax=Chrysochloris asiatica TaxID=185453 RepID=A0A9B0WPG2_CHRAS|nr:PREDICTED: prothymosin alpha-like [Chrysochloris asiatica]